MQQEDLISEAKEFFEYYKKEIGRCAKEGKKSIVVSFHDLVSQSHELAELLLRQPEETLRLLEVALDEVGLITNARIRFTDLPANQLIKIREIRSQHLNQLITIEGIITQTSDIRPEVVNAKFECPSCGSTLSILQLEKRFQEPKSCSCGRRGSFKLLGKEMVDAQMIVLEESPENLTGGEQPRSIDIFLKEDLVEPRMEKRTTPGAKVEIIGVLKEVPIPLRSGAISTRFDLAIEANNILPLEETFEELDINEEDEKEIIKLSEDPKFYEKLRESIAPSILGYSEIKDALALQLFGGVRRIRGDGTASRGDFHILLVGDPGVAKSVILKFISSLAPKGRYVSGKATTGVGITATVIKDEFMKGGWSLRAGAMVLANKGLLAIDELEDMTEEDRSSIHEGMEQQTITVSKATVHATLRAETSILAAGNPKFGRFEPGQPIAKQINIDPALLSRFDLIFIIRDIPERVKDEAIATHVLKERRSIRKKQELSTTLIRKYIAYAKQRIAPELTEKAVEEIKKFYVELRNAGGPVADDMLSKPIPVTARQLEALIRLAEANARARLSNKVTKEDADKAITLLKFCLSMVGYDKETNQYDIDKITTGISASQRSKIIFVRDVIRKLESRFGKLIPLNEIENELGGKIEISEIEGIIEELRRAGEFFEPKKGFIQRTA